jgi:hypothetical protein
MIGKVKDCLAIAGGVFAVLAPTVGAMYYFVRLADDLERFTRRVVVLEENAAPPSLSCHDLIRRELIRPDTTKAELRAIQQQLDDRCMGTQ